MRKVSVLVISIVILSMGIAAHADEKRILWDFNQLPKLGVGQSRMVFGYNLGSSLQDDYSWRVVRPTLTQFQSVLSPCALDSTPDKNFSACIDSVQYRKLGTSNWNAATLSKVQLASPRKPLLNQERAIRWMFRRLRLIRNSSFHQETRRQFGL